MRSEHIQEFHELPRRIGESFHSAIGQIGYGVLRSLRHVRVSNRSRSGKNNGGGAIVAVLAVALALLVIGYVGYFFGGLIKSAVSRQREFLADASAVQFTRYPKGIGGALAKIGGYSRRCRPSRSAERFVMA